MTHVTLLEAAEHYDFIRNGLKEKNYTDVQCRKAMAMARFASALKTINVNIDSRQYFVAVHRVPHPTKPALEVYEWKLEFLDAGKAFMFKCVYMGDLDLKDED